MASKERMTPNGWKDDKDIEIERLQAALEHIASHHGSAEQCWEIAQEALRVGFSQWRETTKDSPPCEARGRDYCADNWRTTAGSAVCGACGRPIRSATEKDTNPYTELSRIVDEHKAKYRSDSLPRTARI